MNSGKYALTWPVRLDPRIERLLDQLPDRVAVRPDDHAPLDGRIVGELRAADDVEVPAREVLRARRDFGDERFGFASWASNAVCSATRHQIEQRSSRMLPESDGPSWTSRSIHEVDLPVSIVALGKVLAEVTAAALFAPQRRARDQAARRSARLKRRQASALLGRQRRGRRHRRASRCRTAVCKPSRVRNSPADRHIRSRTSSDGQRAGDVLVRWLDGSAATQAGFATESAADPACSAAASGRLLHRRRRARAEHQPFEQRVAREPVRAVDAGAGDLAGREQSRQRGPAPLVGVDAAHHVVRRRTDRNRIAREVEADAAGTSRQSSETAGARTRRRDAPASGTPARRSARSSRDDAARDHVARRRDRRPGDSAS